nr:hypothetical protein [Rhodospirillales bacterium]
MYVRKDDRLCVLSEPRQSSAATPLDPAIAAGWSWRRVLKGTVYAGVGLLGTMAVLAVGLLLFGGALPTPAVGPRATEVTQEPTAPAPAATMPLARPAWLAQAQAFVASLHQGIEDARATLGRLRAQEITLLRDLTAATPPPRPRLTAVTGADAPAGQAEIPAQALLSGTPADVPAPTPAAPPHPVFLWFLQPHHDTAAAPDHGSGAAAGASGPGAASASAGPGTAGAAGAGVGSPGGAAASGTGHGSTGSGTGAASSGAAAAAGAGGAAASGGSGPGGAPGASGSSAASGAAAGTGAAGSGTGGSGTGSGAPGAGASGTGSSGHATAGTAASGAAGSSS